MAKKEQTSRKVASAASKVLKDPKALRQLTVLPDHQSLKRVIEKTELAFVKQDRSHGLT